jgi:hypothetical protein
MLILFCAVSKHLFVHVVILGAHDYVFDNHELLNYLLNETF